VTCSSCGVENRPGGRFCSECGTLLAAVCPGCGAPAVPGAKFCAECGERLAPAGPPASRSASGIPSGAERRLVTVLFADLVGFTTIAEGRDAEHVRELLSLYFDLASEIIRRYGGTVEKFIGDAVMAIWGAPTAHEDDAERAVRAALDLVAAIPSLGATIGGDLQARAGVLSGEAAVTVGATNQGLVAGDLVNTASRLQSVAQPGTVLVGESTRDAAAGAIAFEPAGESLLKGKSAPVAAFRALRVVAKVRGVGRSDALEPPFVGRDVEFRLVRDAFHATARDRRARLVSITGEAGVGKSRLAWEFSKYTDGLADQLFWHEGCSPAYGEGISFWALGEMARKRCGLLEADDESTTREGIQATLADHVPDPAERAFVEAALLALLGLAEAPPGGRERLFTGWRTFFERLASVDPVVLLFEDLQWADDGLLDFIDSLFEWSQSYPILVLTLSRPELLDRRPTWGASRSATSLPLGPLADEAMRALLAGLVPGIPDAAARTILERAGGMPLYAVETVRMLVAEGRLEAAGDGTYRAKSALDAIEVPASLQALVAARLDALPAHDRALLQEASVLGQTFSVAALGAIATDGAATLEPRLRSLVARDLLSLDTDPRSPQRGQYGFVQALTREVAYSTLSKRDRRTRHLAAARYFEALGDEELAGALATHYFAAYEAAAEGPEAHALAGQARIALRAAGARARALGSLEQAISYFENAGRLPGGEVEQLALLETAADIGMDSSRYARAEPLYREIAERAVATGDRGTAARVTAGIAEAAFQVDAGRAVEFATKAAEDFADLGSGDRNLLALQMFRARAAVRRGHNRAAADLSESIMTDVERTRDEELILTGLITLGAALSGVGRPVEGLVVLEGALRRAQANGFPLLADRARINLSVLGADDDVRGARDIALAGFEEATSRGLRSYAASFSLNATEYDLHLGNLPTGIERTRSVLELGLEGFDRAVSLSTLHMLYTIAGVQVEDLELEIDGFRAERVSTDDDRRCWAALVAGDGSNAIRHGLAMARDDELNAPFTYLRAAIGAALIGDATTARTASDEHGNLGRWGRWVDATAAATDAIALALEGRRDEALSTGREAIAAFRSQGILLDGALLELGLGVALRPSPASDELLATARETFAAIGALGFVATVDRLTGTGDHASATRRIDEGRGEAQPSSNVVRP
jgi:class 3 adenylate cyclase/tetratricopeptide (TPR) repeat protein